MEPAGTAAVILLQSLKTLSILVHWIVGKNNKKKKKKKERERKNRILGLDQNTEYWIQRSMITTLYFGIVSSNF